jgi:uncharacterized damage-inducible protein DinB
VIDPHYCVIMARYNAWQNTQLQAAFTALAAEAWHADRGAHFGSIQGTASHLVWADTIWMSRFDGGAGPGCPLGESAGLVATVEEWCKLREGLDARILKWSAGLGRADLGGPLTWYSGAVGAEMTRPLSLCILHMFNHQTHHRGQIHALLTAAGTAAPVTDLFLMPEGAG